MENLKLNLNQMLLFHPVLNKSEEAKYDFYEIINFFKGISKLDVSVGSPLFAEKFHEVLELLVNSDAQSFELRFYQDGFSEKLKTIEDDLKRQYPKLHTYNFAIDKSPNFRSLEKYYILRMKNESRFIKFKQEYSIKGRTERSLYQIAKNFDIV